MAAVARFLEKAEGKRNDDELRDLYRQYVGDYELLRNMTVEEAIGYAHDQWAEGQRVQKLEMLAELLYAERLSHVGQQEADRVVNVFNRMMEQLKNERLRLRAERGSVCSG